MKNHEGVLKPLKNDAIYWKSFITFYYNLQRYKFNAGKCVYFIIFHIVYIYISSQFSSEVLWALSQSFEASLYYPEIYMYSFFLFHCNSFCLLYLLNVLYLCLAAYNNSLWRPYEYIVPYEKILWHDITYPFLFHVFYITFFLFFRFCSNRTEINNLISKRT